MKSLHCLQLSLNIEFHCLHLYIGAYVCLHILSDRNYLEKWKQDEPKSDQKTYFVLGEQESNPSVHVDRF